MSDLNMEQLTQQYFDVLKELGNIGAGNATTALAELINCKVDMMVPQVRLLEFNELGDMLGGEDLILVGIYLGVEGDVNGSMMFTLPQESGLHLVTNSYNSSISSSSSSIGSRIRSILNCTNNHIRCNSNT